MMPDLRYAFRRLAKEPGFTATAILTLALGIGANTAIFSMLDAVLLQPLPYPQPERLVRIRERTPVFDSGAVSYPNYLDWRANQRGFTDLALYRRGEGDLSSANAENQPERVGAGRISFNFFSILGVVPELGRDLREADDLPNSRRVILISDALWKRRFGASLAILGQEITFDGITREVIGVVPPTAEIPQGAEVYVPLGELRGYANVLDRTSHQNFSVLGRLRPGVTLEQATADLNNIAAELERRYPDSNAGRRIETMILLEVAVKDYKHGVTLLLVAVGCVLLIACANVANLELARALARDRELAVRAALGASRARLAAQTFLESALLATFGAIAGVLLSFWALDAIKALAPADAPRFQETRLDLPVFAFTGFVAVAAGILVSIWPALRITRNASLTLSLREGGHGASEGGRRQCARSGLVVAQVALALLLLAAAGLMLKSFRNAQNAPLGFDPHGILTASIDLPRAHFESDEEVATFNRQLVERVRALPGVEAAALTGNSPFADNEWDGYFHITGAPPAQPGHEPSAEINSVSPDYFRVLRMPILRGRAFDSRDQLNSPSTTIIDTSFAARCFPGKDAIGQQIDNLVSDNKDAPPLTIVGVVPRTRNNAPEENNLGKYHLVQMYVPLQQLRSRGNILLVRAKSGDPLALVPAIKRELHALDPDQALASVSTMDEEIAKSLGPRRLMMSLLSVFAALALILASVGLYGVMALTVTQRRRELGIRLALGANRADVFRLVLSQGMLLVFFGLIIGLLAALGAGRELQSALYGVGGTDLSALSIAVSALTLVALVACWLPARRATQVDPIIALRAE